MYDQRAALESLLTELLSCRYFSQVAVLFVLRAFLYKDFFFFFAQSNKFRGNPGCIGSVFTHAFGNTPIECCEQ